MKRLNFQFKTEHLKIVSVAATLVGVVGTLVSKELSKRDNEELINKIVDARIDEHYASMKASNISN